MPSTGRISHQGAASGDRALDPPLHRAWRILDGFAGWHDRGGSQWWRKATGKIARSTVGQGGVGKLGSSSHNPERPVAARQHRRQLPSFAAAGRALLDEVEAELGWMYETLHTDGETSGRIDYTVWSEVFRCPECAAEVVFVDEALDRTTGRVRTKFPCPDCDAELNKDRLERVFETNVDSATGNMRQHVAFRPSLIRYTVDGGTFEKPCDASDDGERLQADQPNFPLPSEVPSDLIPRRCTCTHGTRPDADYSGVTSHPSLLSSPGRACVGGDVAAS